MASSQTSLCKNDSLSHAFLIFVQQRSFARVDFEAKVPERTFSQLNTSEHDKFGGIVVF